MKCPKCGGTAKYVESRKKYWKGKSAKGGTTPRTDFRAKCSKCGWSGEIHP